MLLLSPLILELQPERIHVINLSILFNGDTNNEFLGEFLFPSKAQQFKTILSL